MNSLKVFVLGAILLALASFLAIFGAGLGGATGVVTAIGAIAVVGGGILFLFDR